MANTNALQPEGFHHRVKDVHDRGMSAVFTPSRLQDENVIHFDFETIPINGAAADEGGKGVSHDKQEPFELGLSVYNKKTGRMVHETFRFSPQMLNNVKGDDRHFGKDAMISEKVGKEPDIDHAMQGQHHVLKYDPAMKGDDPYKDANVLAIRELITPYATGKDKNGKGYKSVNWKAINKFLSDNHVNFEQNTNFVAWNGQFDYPILEKLLLHAGGMDSHLATLYKKASGGRGGAYLDQPSGIEMIGKKGSEYRNPNYEEGARRINDRDAGNFRHDAMVESARLFGHQYVGRGPHRLVLLSDPTTPDTDKDNRNIANGADKNGYAFHKIAYHPDMEWGYSLPNGAAGSGLGSWRHVISSRCFGSESADFPVEAGDIKNFINDIFSGTHKEGSGENKIAISRADFIKDRLGLDLDHVNHALRLIYKNSKEDRAKKPPSARQWFDAAMNVGAHSGVGDTAFMSELLLPMFGSFADHFGSKRFEGLTPAQRKTFSSDAAAFLRGWGDILAVAPTRNPGGKSPQWLNPVAPLSAIDHIFNAGNFIGHLQNEVNGLPVTEPEKQEDDGSPKVEGDGNTPKPNPVIKKQRRKNLVPRKEDFGEDFQDSIGNIDYVKWVGTGKDGEPRDVAIVTVGGTRVAFSASYGDSNTIQEWVPFSGVTNVRPYKEEGNPAPVGKRMSDGIQQVLETIIPDTLNEINRVLMEGAGSIQEYTEKMPPLPHDGEGGLNERINTTASRIADETFKDGKSLSYTESNSHLPLPGRPMRLRRDALRNLINDERIRYRFLPGEDGEGTVNRSREELAGFLHLLLTTGHEGEGMLEHLRALDPETLGLSEEWLEQPDQETLKGFIENGAEINGTPIMVEIGEIDDDDDAIKMDEATGAVTVNINRLFSDYIRGLTPFGTNISQFTNINKLEEDWNGGLAHQLKAFIGCNVRIYALGMEPEDALREMFEDNYIIPLDNTKPMEDQPDEPSEDIADEEKRGLADSWLVFGNPHGLDEDDWIIQNASPEALEKARDRWAYYNWGQDNPNGSAEDRQAWTDMQVRLRGTPFIEQYQIDSALARATKEEAFSELFPPREVAETEEGVSQLIEDAIATYGADSDLPSATGLVRELEWIRANHPEHFTTETLAELLNEDESVASEHVAGRWMAAVTMGYGAMGDKAQEEMAFIEQERIHMGDDLFMGNAHRSFLYDQLQSSGQTDWEQVEEPTTPKQQVLDESDEPLISWGDLARQMAVGTAKSPISALKYLTNWNQISTQAKDTWSGRTDAGKKLMEAARKDEDLFRVNIGTEEEPKFIQRLSEFNYYTGNLPIEGDKQRNVLARFLNGPKTFDDLRAEEQKDTSEQVKEKVGNSLDRLHEYSQQQMRERFPLIPTTPEEQQAAAAAQGGRQFNQNLWEIGIEDAFDDQINPPSEREQPLGTIPRTEFNPSTGNYDPVQKSLDRLREYLLRV